MAALNKCRENPGSRCIYLRELHLQKQKAMEFEYKAINGQYGEDVEGYFFRPGGEYVIALDMDNFRTYHSGRWSNVAKKDGMKPYPSQMQKRENKRVKIDAQAPPFTTGKIVNSSTDYLNEIDRLNTHT